MNLPSFYYQAIEYTKVYSLDYDYFMKITSKDAGLLEFNRSYIGKEIMKRSFLRSDSFIFLNPEERYKNFLKEHSNIINRVPVMYIAYVLGITPVSLSRIKHRIAKRK